MKMKEQKYVYIPILLIICCFRFISIKTLASILFRLNYICLPIFQVIIPIRVSVCVTLYKVLEIFETSKRNQNLTTYYIELLVQFGWCVNESQFLPIYLKIG